MNSNDRLNYIMGERIGWLDTALLSDIRTLIKGGEVYKNKHSDRLGGFYGAGNVSLPLLICTGLEFASALYTGKTQYNMGKKNNQPEYEAPQNVQKFIKKYFPKNAHAKKITLIMWDALRNGTHHLFIPKSMKDSKYTIEFMFYVDNVKKPSHITKVGNKIKININSIEFYHTLKKSLKDYRAEIKHKPALQRKFIKAWTSISPRVIKSTSPMSKEMKYLK